MSNPFDLIDARLSNIESLLIALKFPVTPPPAPPEPRRLYGDKAAAEYLGCTPLTILKLRNSGAISFYRYGRKFYFITSELDNALKVDARKFGRGKKVAK
ncbi:MAG: helix-turn-helix domain-containing protein [Mariniphaga sp.]